MADYLENTEIFAWMPLIGFDKNLSDKGVSDFLNRTQFLPHGINLFLFHADIVHKYTGLTEEVILPPDNCNYYASPYNEERSRQEWTNYDLKTLLDHLNSRGIDPYLSIMGIDLGNQFHQEWIYEHPEILGHYRTFKGGIHALKRFKDGTYYEDFFVEQVCRVMEDYGFRGLHVADIFCPTSILCDGDFSFDMLEQFSMHTHIKIPDDIASKNDESFEAITRRSDWIWENHRQQWIQFYAWRWETFWKKVCDRLHAIGRKVYVLGMYCTDPFETLYCYGVDLKRIVNAGVDYLMPNMAANGGALRHNRPWRYYEQANMMPLTDAFVEGSKKINMLSVKDVTEEWDMIHHNPVLLERDINFLLSYHRQVPNGRKRCLDGFNICLSDGIYKDEWEWIGKRITGALDKLPKKSLAPTYVWSDHAHYGLLPEYIQTRRWSLHKFMWELSKLGSVNNSIVRAEHITENSGDLFIPNFDLLSEDEKNFIANYRGGSVICTASIENGFHPETYGIHPDIYFEDRNSVYKNCAFAFNLIIESKENILKALEEEDRSPEISDPFNAEESHNTLSDYMPFQKVSIGFLKACASLLRENIGKLIFSNHTVIPSLMEDGAIRMMIINDDWYHYANATITIKDHQIKEIKNVSQYPLLPIKFSDNKTFNWTSSTKSNGSHTFKVLVPQTGISIVDVYLDD